tara:strand:+ start:150 stop:911 length:762 start_codon:yes stop_codon:yes gene_type:complete
MPLVSVIIPYFKKKEYIKRTIDSVLNQTFKDFEILIIYDDVDIDDYNFLKKNFENIQNIKIIKNSKNLGAGLSRNIGIANSSSEFLAFLDADDLWLETKLDEQIKYMNENNFSFTFCNYKKYFLKKKFIEVKASKNILAYKDLLNSCDIGLSTVILRRNIVNDDFFPKLKTQEDYAAWLKLTKSNINAYNLKKTLVIWNEVDNSLSSNFFQKILDGFKVYYIYEKFNIFKSIFFLLKLSLNSIKRKLNFYNKN